MDRILNSDELQALREAVELDAIDQPDGAPEPDSVILDGAELPVFRFGERRKGGQRDEMLSSLFARVARMLATRLSDILEAPIGVSVTWLEQTRFSGFRDVFELDGRELACARFPAPGGTGGGLVSIEPEVISRVVEGMMGGNAMAEAPRNGRRDFRPMSELDLRVSRRWVTGFLQDLGQAWNPSDKRELLVTGLESGGAAVRSFSTSAPVIAALLEISTPRQTIGMLGVVVPEAAADAIVTKNAEEQCVRAPQSGPTPLEPAVPDFEVQIDVALAEKRMSVREFLGLAVGDVLFMDPRQSTTGYVQGVPKFQGVPGALNGNKAIQITSVLGRTQTHA